MNVSGLVPAFGFPPAVKRHRKLIIILGALPVISHIHSGMTQHVKKNALDPRHDFKCFVRNIKSRGLRSSGTLRRNDRYIATDVSG
jgi:hypothetical protein